MRTEPHFGHAVFPSFQQLKTSVLHRPSQQVRRELAAGERFSGGCRLSRSTGKPRKPQESCERAGGSGGGRVRALWRMAWVKGIELPVTAGRKLGLIVLLERQARRDLCRIAHANRSVLPPALACVLPLDLEVIRTWRTPTVQTRPYTSKYLRIPTLAAALSLISPPPKVKFFLIQKDSITQTVLTTHLSHCFRTRLHQICVRQKRQNSDFQGAKTLYLSFS